ncbi:reverse transcriptase/maturase family protein [Clostridium nigeriense]|uniref:reverse transcriptase/maturase family protein n=1 Tax=Clostridium nigeriense TaxID=1805470 RepID=UPI003D32A37B
MEKLLKWKKENARPAGYAHFDEKFGLNTAWDYITKPNKVARHSFFPFITYDQIFYKVSKKDGKVVVKDKVRPICYSAHIDRCIYQYYGYLLNEKYNDYVKREGISESVVAYRTNLHKNNINFAKQAFDFIKKDDCNIIVGDFKGFFDNLDHKYLKSMLCEVLGVETLSNDWYAVYKNITRYSTWDLTDILKINGLITDADIKEKKDAHKDALDGKTRKARKLIKNIEDKIEELNGFKIEDPKIRSKKLALTKEQFKQYKKSYLKIHKDTFGIPQGSSISTVLSNVYMIDFDKKISRFIKKFNGMYLRYSDDFIIILPKDSEVTFTEVVTYLRSVVVETDKLTLEAKKTQIYSYENNEIINITKTTDNYKSYIDYLGFIFDGKQVTLRPKTVSKYYYRMYKKLNHIVKSKGFSKKGNKISYTELYKTYTQKGRSGEYDPLKLPMKVIIKDKNNPYKSGNFFSYVYKADEIFNSEYVGKNKVENPVNHKEPITQSTQRHMLKIRRVRDKIK